MKPYIVRPWGTLAIIVAKSKEDALKIAKDKSIAFDLDDIKEISLTKRGLIDSMEKEEND